MRFSHVLITRPQKESEQLAAMLATLGIEPVVLPAFRFRAGAPEPEEVAKLQKLADTGQRPLLIFTSTRSVEFGLNQLPGPLLSRARVAAIGPSTAKALENSGCKVDIRPHAGYTSEALIATLESLQPSGGGQEAFVLAAPGGRDKLASTLGAGGWTVHMLWAYHREQAAIDEKVLAVILAAEKVLSVWTSANAMKALSQRLPPAAWYRLCTGEWLVISDRLQRLARAYGPSRIHRTQGPTNQDILAAVKSM